MTITFKCEHCGKKIEAPDSVGGKRGKCPYCKQSNYIPAPVSDDEIIDLAPEDAADEKRVRAEAETLRQQEKGLIAEMDVGESQAVPLEQREDLEGEDVRHLVVNYCLALADGKVEQAEVNLAEMRELCPASVTAVEDFLAGKAIEPALDRIPTKILHGFLAQLRDALESS